MSDLTEFLLTRIAEDERHARKLAETDRRPVLSLATTINHPQRLLAEAKAKRAIVAEHAPVDPCDAHDAAFKTVACTTLLALAAIYSDHPEYREEWTPKD